MYSVKWINESENKTKKVQKLINFLGNVIWSNLCNGISMEWFFMVQYSLFSFIWNAIAFQIELNESRFQLHLNCISYKLFDATSSVELISVLAIADNWNWNCIHENADVLAVRWTNFKFANPHAFNDIQFGSVYILLHSCQKRNSILHTFCIAKAISKQYSCSSSSSNQFIKARLSRHKYALLLFYHRKKNWLWIKYYLHTGITKIGEWMEFNEYNFGFVSKVLWKLKFVSVHANSISWVNFLCSFRIE